MSSDRNDFTQVPQTELNKTVEDLELGTEGLSKTVQANSLDLQDIISSDRATLVTIILDASGSMSSYADTVIKVFRDKLVPTVQKSSEVDSIVFHLITFNSTVSSSGMGHVSTIPYDQYRADGSTSLYDAVCYGAKNHIDYLANLKANNLSTRSVVIIMTDGGENNSEATTQSAQRAIAKLVKQEDQIVFIGFGDSAADEGRNMGVPDHQIHKVDTINDQVIKNIFAIISSSIVAVSSGATKKNDSFFAGAGNNLSESSLDAFSQSNSLSEENSEGDAADPFGV